MIGFVALLAWGTMALAQGGARWVLLVFAVLLTALFARIFGKVMSRGFGGSPATPSSAG